MRKFVRWLIIAILNLIGDIEVITLDNVPSQGAFVIATNHIGIIDIAMLHYKFDRFDMFIPVAEKWEKVGWIRHPRIRTVSLATWWILLFLEA